MPTTTRTLFNVFVLKLLVDSVPSKHVSERWEKSRRKDLLELACSEG